MAERWTVSGLRDFLCLELGKAIEHGTLHGNAGCADIGSSTSRGARQCTVDVSCRGRRKRPAGRWGQGLFLRTGFGWRRCGNSISGRTKILRLGGARRPAGFHHRAVEGGEVGGGAGAADRGAAGGAEPAVRPVDSGGLFFGDSGAICGVLKNEAERLVSGATYW